MNPVDPDIKNAHSSYCSPYIAYENLSKYQIISPWSSLSLFSSLECLNSTCKEKFRFRHCWGLKGKRYVLLEVNPGMDRHPIQVVSCYENRVNPKKF